VQERLFEVEDYTLAEYLRSENLLAEYPLLSMLGITVDQFYDVPSMLLEIIPKPGALTYEAGGGFKNEFVDGFTGTAMVYKTVGQYKSRFTDKFAVEDDNFMHWNTRTGVRSFMGFLELAASLDDNKQTPILHVVPWVPDLESSFAIRLEDISEVRQYPKNAADVLAAYQNAAEDGDTYCYQAAVGLPTDVLVSQDELAPLVHGYWWPEPKLIYSADQPIP
jgi:hypothetical protein